MTTRKLNGPLGGDYQTDGAGNAVLLNTYPLTEEDDVPLRLADHEARVTAAEGVQTSQGRGLVAPNPGAARLNPLPVPMADPPDLTLSAGGAASSISSGVTIPWTDDRFHYLGASPVPFLLNSVNYGRVETEQTGQQPSQVVYSVEFECDCQQIELLMNSQSAAGRARLWIDGQPTSVTATTIGTTNFQKRWLVEFAARGNHHVLLEMMQETRFAGVTIGPTDSLWATVLPRGPKVSIVGDSYIAAGNLTDPMQSFVNILSQSLGWRDVRWAGQGGTGYLNPRDTGYRNFLQRITHDVITPAAEIVIVQGSINDLSTYTTQQIGDQAQAYFQSVRSNLPATTILIVVLPFWFGANAGSKTVTDNARVELSARAAPYADLIIDPWGEGWYTGTGKTTDLKADGNADRYRGNDGTHPTDAGAAYHGRRLASRIAAAMPILGAN